MLTKIKTQLLTRVRSSRTKRVISHFRKDSHTSRFHGLSVDTQIHLVYSRMPKWVNRFRLFWGKPVHVVEFKPYALPWENKTAMTVDGLLKSIKRSLNYSLLGVKDDRPTIWEVTEEHQKPKNFKLFFEGVDMNEWFLENTLDTIRVKLTDSNRKGWGSMDNRSQSFRLEFFSNADAVRFKFLIQELNSLT